MNQKNHFVSIYQKDYTWPHVLDICQTELPTKPDKDLVCACTDSPRMLKELLDASLDRAHCQTEQLSKPIICPMTRSIPHAIQLDQPSNICVKKLEEECPDLEELLEMCSDEKRARTDADRFKTTYQAHYSDPATARMTQRDLGRAILHTDTYDQQMQCRMPIKITIETDCPPHCHPFSSRINETRNDCKRKNASFRGKRCEISTKPHAPLPAWKTEYQDNINKIGQAIMRVKLHHAKKKTFPLQYQRCESD
ncbi:hypothetical protein ACFW04_010913 [Cataglyphis niger]